MDEYGISSTISPVPVGISALAGELGAGASVQSAVDHTAGTFRGYRHHSHVTSHSDLIEREFHPTTGGRAEVLWRPAAAPILSCETSILIVDDCTLYREYLTRAVVAHGAQSPSAAWDISSMDEVFRTVPLHVILLNMSTRSSGMLLRQAVKSSSTVRVIAMGLSEDDESAIVDCAEAGVAGYHLRSESLDDLLVLISQVVNGQSFCSPRIAAILLNRLRTRAAHEQPESREPVLTTRETQILRLLETGLSNRDIADQLCIALHTVKNHVHSVLGKLGVSTRAEAAAYSRSVRHSALAAEI